jgi:TetR/AcrR family transcriptional regulator, transcriptional repressor of bet genes
MPYAMDLPVARPSRRKVSKDLRRQQLIEATIETLARKGYAQMTLTDVALKAGVSHGLVNFHFQSKEKLLTETLLNLSSEYLANWQAYLAEAPKDAASQFDALIRADLDPEVCTPTKISCWTSFWAESQSRPIYQKECGANDEAYIRLLEGHCARMIEEAGYALAAADAARVFRSLSDGVWQDMAYSAAPYTRDHALRIMYVGAAALFPKHFTAEGPLVSRSSPSRATTG